SAPTLRPNFTARCTASWFNTGNVPGNPRSTNDACVLGSAPYVVELPENNFDWVESCTCTSSPMTVSHCMVFSHVEVICILKLRGYFFMPVCMCLILMRHIQ